MPDFIVTSPDGKESFMISAPGEAQGAREAAAGHLAAGATHGQEAHPIEPPEHMRSWGNYGAWTGEHMKKAIADAFHHPEGLVNAGPLGVLKLVAAGPAKDLGYGMTRHLFNIMDEAGNRVGWTKLTNNPSKRSVDVDMIQSETPRQAEKPGSMGYAINPEAHSFGHADTRSLLREVKREFPEAESLRGYRVTGARQATGQLGGTTIPLPGSSAKVQPQVRLQRDQEMEDWTMRQWEQASEPEPQVNSSLSSYFSNEAIADRQAALDAHRQNIAPPSLEAGPESLSARGPSSLRGPEPSQSLREYEQAEREWDLWRPAGPPE